MNLLTNSKSILTVISDPCSARSHRIRLIVSEKDVEADMITISLNEPLAEDLLEINPSEEIPFLVDRGMILYNERVISEYLDERFPHPSFMPVEPIIRARLRLLVHQIETTWYPIITSLEQDDLSANKRKILSKELKDSISLTSPLFKESNFLFHESISLLDCAVLPILWRLQHFKIALPEQATRNIKNYATKMFKRSGFAKSLSDYERELHPLGNTLEKRTKARR